MKKQHTKISLFILITLFFVGCDTLKKVPEAKRLLASNKILIDGKKNTSEEIDNLLYQKQNTSILGYKLRLNLFNLAHEKHDSIYKAKFINNPEKYFKKSKFLSAKQVNRLGNSFWYAGIHDFLKNTGEPPVLFDKLSADKTLKRFNSYLNNQGYFNAKASYSLDSSNSKKIKVNYSIIKNQPFMIDSIKTTILSPKIDSLYQTRKQFSNLKTNKQYQVADFENEISRLTTQFRNNGAYLFQPNNITFDIDTLVTPKKANINLKISDYSYRENDTAKTKPFKLYKISEVKIITDFGPGKSKSVYKDSISYNNFDLYSFEKLKYRPKAITDAVFITKGSLFSEENTTLTSRYLSKLKVFNYPSITYKQDLKDSTNTSLIASVYLSPRKKYSFSTNLDVTYSNIINFGIALSPSVTIRNVFNGAETLEMGLRGNIGSSKYFANPQDNFFNVLEYGLDMKLNFPRVLMFFNTNKILPKKMIPSTTFSVGFSKQQNIGLDKENFTSSFSYNWTPKKNTNAKFELVDLQFVKNINPTNYFNVYRSSYSRLNDIASNTAYATNPSYFQDGSLIIESGTNGFINSTLNNPSLINNNQTDLKTINSINEQKNRLTENNLIFASNYQFYETTKTDLADESFYVFRSRLESAGIFLSALANVSKQLKNQNGSNTFLEVEYSQYFKSEFEFIKHWDLRNQKVFAIRNFVGIAVPYGNANSIPFSRSYSAGGPNDNRAWQPYSLGPGKSSNFNDFNEANLKIAASAEFRYNIFNQLNGAFFVDAGNIWNVLDNVTDTDYVFNNLNSLTELAIGSGFGLRYDFRFFVFRLDLGFKTYNPGREEGDKWLKELNFSKSALNIGINYPF